MGVLEMGQGFGRSCRQHCKCTSNGVRESRGVLNSYQYQRRFRKANTGRLTIFNGVLSVLSEVPVKLSRVPDRNVTCSSLRMVGRRELSF